MSRDALVVGISHYKNLPSLCAPARDAEDIARCLEGFGECRVVRSPEAIQAQKPVISQQAVVTTKMLEDALIRLFKPAGKNIPQTAIFYFSGHGLQRNAGIQEGYLATSDTDPDTGNYGLSLYWLRRLLQESPVRQRVIMLDCCNSGEFFNILEADPGAKSGTDRLFMAASREYEEAYESLTGSHSVFTKALLSGLNPYKAKGSIINGHHLIDTVNNQLKGELQQPLFESSGSEIVLTRAGGKIHQPELSESSALDRLRQLRYKYCPFQGLAPFEATHGDFLFGREEITRSLVELVQSSRLSLLTGASGIGKTSILQAGLIYTLTQQNRAAQETQWDIRYVRLGHDPLKQLAEAFVDPKVSGLQRAEQIRTAESFVQNGAQGMTHLVRATLGQHSNGAARKHRILLVIDQFEALFVPATCDGLGAQRQTVLNCLMAVVNKDHVPIHIVLGMRSQHLQDLETNPEFHALVANHCLAVPPMTYDQLKSTIIGPLDKVGLQYEANLIYTLLLDVVGSPGELPLLQLALSHLWHHREQESINQLPPRLTLETYVKLGGLRQILRQHATRVLDGLSAVDKPIARRILLSLCEFGEGSTPSRRPVELEELVTQSVSAAQVSTTLNQLLAARLMVVNADHDLTLPLLQANPCQSVPAWASGTRTDNRASALNQLFQAQRSLADRHDRTAPYFEISHDSLLHNWPLLEGWLQEHRPLMKLQRSIEAAALEWHHQNRPNHPDYFLSQSRLSEAILFQGKQGEHLSALAHQYLTMSRQKARLLKRKSYLMRLLIPLSMATGMLAAYGHTSLTQSVHSQGSSSPAATATAQAEPVPRFQKADAGAAALNTAGNPAEPSPRQGKTISLQRASQPDGPGVTAGQSTTSDTQHRSGRGDSQPGVIPLLPSTHHSNLGIEVWQQSLQGLSLTLNPVHGAIVHQQPDLTELDLLPKPVAEWVSPSDPQVMIKVWCAPNQTEPVCFSSSTPLSSALSLPSSRL